MKLKAHLRIGRPSRSDQRETIDIQIIDQISGTQFCELEISLDDFARCLTGLHITNVDMELRWLERIGKIHEHKTELVQFPMLFNEQKTEKQRKKDALKPFEIEGWKGHEPDLGNGHRGDSRGGYRVTFHRHVDPETGKPVL